MRALGVVTTPRQDQLLSLSLTRRIRFRTARKRERDESTDDNNNNISNNRRVNHVFVLYGTRTWVIRRRHCVLVEENFCGIRRE
jgi:hypothetical protein